MSENGSMRLGVCYYPEHWPEEWWADDARRMAEMGLSRVRIGEFAWSRIEPEPGRFDWGWLDRAIETLRSEKLGVIMCTPTATPPKWLVDQMPDMIAVDESGKPRRFGSRRHYCFSHLGYRKESARITNAVAERYGTNPAIVAWQTDNEYGCHDTAVSYSPAAEAAFRLWLNNRYETITALNSAWGNVFWSQEYRSFDEVDLPNLTVTEPNPAHILAFRRFSSDQVVAFNRIQINILKSLSPGRDVIHNFMGFFTQFDHHDVGADLDIASWDSYPLGFLEQFWFSDAEKQHYAHQSHPDIAAFHHDLYRCCSNGRWAVMEQQPGPVNWARYNPAPLPGMVRLWTLEAMAHGAEFVSYFRWRQAPFAQEQMHAGLLRPDRVDDVAAGEVRATASDIQTIGAAGTQPKSVALIYSYESDWITDTQPQGKGLSALRVAFEYYTALRKLGLDIDIVGPDASLAEYQMVVVPCLPIVSDDLAKSLVEFNGPVLIGARTGSKTSEFAIPKGLPPGPLQSWLGIKVTRVESLRDGYTFDGAGFEIARWLEHTESAKPPLATLENGMGVWFSNDGKAHYLACWPDRKLLRRVLETITESAGIKTVALADDVRTRCVGEFCFAFNYGKKNASFDPNTDSSQKYSPIIGTALLQPAGVTVWQKESQED
jgi:beta-galactosidase